jgi:hypothetical protein
MTSFFGALLLVAGVIALIKVSGLLPRALQAVRRSRSAFDVISDPQLPDERKESLLREYSLSLLRSFLDLLIRGAGSIVIPVALLWALEFAGVLSLKAVLDLTLSWPFLLGSAIAAICAFRLWGKINGL